MKRLAIVIAVMLAAIIVIDQMANHGAVTEDLYWATVYLGRRIALVAENGVRFLRGS